MRGFRKPYPVSMHDPQNVAVHGFPGMLDLSSQNAPAAPYNFTNVNLITSKLDVSIVASLGFDKNFEGSANSNMNFYLLDLVIALPEEPIDGHPLDFGLVYGAGIRVGFLSTKSEAKFESSIAGVAAGASLNVQTASYSSLALHISPEIAKSGSAFFKSGFGSFDGKDVESLGEGLQRISSALISLASTIKPGPLWIVASPNPDELALIQSISTCWALNRIIEGKSCNQALGQISVTNVDQALIDKLNVKVIYRKIVNDTGNDVPSPPQIEDARNILKLRNEYA